MALDKTKVVYGTEAKFLVQVAPATGSNGTPGTYTQLCIDGAFTFNDSWNESSVDDGLGAVWCTSASDLFATVLLDQRNVNFTMNIVYMPGDAVIAAQHTIYENKGYTYYKITMIDGQATPSQKVMDMKGKYTSWPLTVSGLGSALKATPVFQCEQMKPGGGWV
jgi:hypothetical protein